MRRLIISLTAFVTLYCGCHAVRQSAEMLPSSSREIPSPALSFSLPKPEHWQLSNGLQVYFMRDEEVPQIRGRLLIRGGELYDDSGIPGLAQATGAELRDGGIPGHPPAVLDAVLDEMGASIESEFGKEYGSVSFFCLGEDFERVFPLFADVVRRPGFAAERLALWKKHAADKVRARRDEAETIATMSFAALVYGKEHPHARALSESSLAKINEPSLRRFSRRFIRPDQAVLALSGALSVTRAHEAVEHAFADWPKPDVEPQYRIPSPQPAPPGIYLLERQFAQTTIVVGHLGPPRFTADEYPLQVFNRLFGDPGFGTMLFSEIRTRLGLAYTVYGGLWPDAGGGLFEVYLATQAKESASALKRVLSITHDLQSWLPELPELEDAKQGLQRGLPFKYANAEQTVTRFAMLYVLGYPADFDENYAARIGETAPGSLAAIARRLIRPEEVRAVVVGNVSPEALAEATGGSTDLYRLRFNTSPEIGEKLVLPRNNR